jgi:AdoMet-dependent rRNA methyltransferase SPB1
VCRDFIAPKHIDPKFLDPRHVFKDTAPLPPSITEEPVEPLSSSTATTAATQASTSASANAAAKLAAGSNHAHANVFMPEKKRRHREGYADGDYTLFHSARAVDFVKGTDPVSLLGTMNKIEFVSEEEKS